MIILVLLTLPLKGIKSFILSLGIIWVWALKVSKLQNAITTVHASPSKKEKYMLRNCNLTSRKICPWTILFFPFNHLNSTQIDKATHPALKYYKCSPSLLLFLSVMISVLVVRLSCVLYTSIYNPWVCLPLWFLGCLPYSCSPLSVNSLISPERFGYFTLFL